MYRLEYYVMHGGTEKSVWQMAIVGKEREKVVNCTATSNDL